MNLIRSPKRGFSLLSIILIIVLGALLVYYTNWPFYVVWLIALSIITFILYGFDKTQAKLNGPRVPEIVLHGLTLLGGFLGGWLGRGIFRHKTRKLVFLIVLFASTLLHVAGTLWMYN